VRSERRRWMERESAAKRISSSGRNSSVDVMLLHEGEDG